MFNSRSDSSVEGGEASGDLLWWRALVETLHRDAPTDLPHLTHKQKHSLLSLLGNQLLNSLLLSQQLSLKCND